MRTRATKRERCGVTDAARRAGDKRDPIRER
jgi:hypothetical protein